MRACGLLSRARAPRVCECVFEFDIKSPDDVSVVSEVEATHTRFSVNLNAALQNEPQKAKEARARTDAHPERNCFRQNNVARGVGTPYRLYVSLKSDKSSAVFKIPNRVFGPTSEFGRTSNQDKLNSLQSSACVQLERFQETIEEMMPEIVTRWQLHLARAPSGRAETAAKPLPSSASFS